MENTKNALPGTPWTWADQISTYRFWGLLFFTIFLLVPELWINMYLMIFLTDTVGISVPTAGIFFAVKSFSIFIGIWLAWLTIRMKNHYLLYLYSFLVLAGLLLLYLVASSASGLSAKVFFGIIASLFFGLTFGALILTVQAIISGGRGGSGMFVISYGLILCYILSDDISIPNRLTSIYELLDNARDIILFLLGFVIIGTLLLIPVKAILFNGDPPKREFGLTPKYRNPWIVLLLCLVPGFNIYYIIHLYYRYHGEVNTIYPSQNILSPRAAVWCTILLITLFLGPAMLSSLNTSLTDKLTAEGNQKFYKNRMVILWAFLCLPISFALIQSNLNTAIGTKRN